MPLIDKLKGWLWIADKPLAKEDRIDPEDAAARAHAEKIQAAQKDHAFPVQVLRDKTKTPDKVSWDELTVKDQSAKTVPFETWIDVYEGPRGIGYVINYETTRGGKVFRKALNVGPEVEREQDWAEVKPMERMNG